MKLTTRFTTCGDQIQLVINNFTTNTDVELQQRSVEYDTIFRKYEPLRPGLLERMPLISADSNTLGDSDQPAVNGDATSNEKSKIEVAQVQQQKESDSLLDLLGDGLPVTTQNEPSVPSTDTSGGLLDLLNMDGSSAPAPVAPQQPQQCKSHYELESTPSYRGAV